MGRATGDDVLEYLTAAMAGEATASTAQLKAAELLGRYHGLWKQLAEIEPGGITIVFTGEDQLAD